jgi:teichuronic acid exporter
MTEPTSAPPLDEQPSSGHLKRIEHALGSSMAWNVASSISNNLVTMLVFIYLTYKLEAAVFGLFALGVIIVDYFNFQARSACLDAAIQRRLYSKPEMDTIFWAMMGVTLGVIIVCMFGGVWLARANGQPLLAYMMPVLALTLIPQPFSIPPNAVMVRDHDFKGGAIRGILGAAAGAIAALAVVFSPFAEWALVAQRGVQVLVTSVAMLVRVGWWPSFHFSPPLAASYMKDVGRIFAAQAIGTSYMRVLDLVVAFHFGAASVGFMRIASRFVEIIYGTFIAPISFMWVVFVSEAGRSKADSDMIYRRLSQLTAVLAMPIFGGLALTSTDVVAVTLSKDYAPTADMLWMLCLVGLMSPLTYFRNGALVAVRRLNLLVVYSVLDLIIVLAAALALAQYSAVAVVGSLLIVEAVRLVLTVPILLKDMHTKPINLFLAVLPAYAACAVMAGAVLLIAAQTAGMAPWPRLGLKISAGAAAYVGYLLVFHRDWSLTALRTLMPGGRSAPAGESVTVPV